MEDLLPMLQSVSTAGVEMWWVATAMCPGDRLGDPCLPLPQCHAGMDATPCTMPVLRSSLTTDECRLWSRSPQPLPIVSRPSPLTPSQKWEAKLLETRVAEFARAPDAPGGDSSSSHAPPAQPPATSNGAQASDGVHVKAEPDDALRLRGGAVSHPFLLYQPFQDLSRHTDSRPRTSSRSSLPTARLDRCRCRRRGPNRTPTACAPATR